MSTPTLEQMKLAVAKMLPDVLMLDRRRLVMDDQTKEVTWEHKFAWKDTGRTVSDREWLHVCLLVERGMIFSQRKAYRKILQEVCSPSPDNHFIAMEELIHATEIPRLEALCRLKCPGMFTAIPLAA